MAKKEQIENKIRLKVRAYDHRVIDSSARQIIETAQRNGAQVVGPIPLPTEVRKYTVNKSTFVHKKSRDQFGMRAHKRMIEILNPNQKIVEALSTLSLPSGVDVEIKMV